MLGMALWLKSKVSKLVRMKRRLHKWFCLFVGMFCVLQAEAYDFRLNGIYYEIDGDELVVTNETDKEDSNSYSGIVIIPSEITYGGRVYTVTGIKARAFQNCSGVTRVEMPSTVTHIGDFAFSVCSNLTSINIPPYITSIGQYAFSSTAIGSIVIPNTIKNISNGAFFRCNNLRTIEIPNSVIAIGESAFALCENLELVSIGESVESIGPSSFAFCSKLKSMMIPSRVHDIGIYAFSLCNELKEVHVQASIPPIIDAETFSDYNKTLYVPINCSDAYRVSEYWKNFEYIVESADESAIESIVNEKHRIYVVGHTLHVENREDIYRVYNLIGQIVYTGSDRVVRLSDSGVYVICTKESSFKVVVR